MKRYRIFKVTTINETNNKPIRIKIVDTWRQDTIIVGYSAEGSSDRVHRAIEVLKEKGIFIEADGYEFDGSVVYLMTQDFKTRI